MPHLTSFAASPQNRIRLSGVELDEQDSSSYAKILVPQLNKKRNSSTLKGSLSVRYEMPGMSWSQKGKPLQNHSSQLLEPHFSLVA